MMKAVSAALILSALAWADPLTNGGFETGALPPWTDAGDTTSLVVTTLDGGEFLDPLIFPTEGDYFAVVGTGPGDLLLDDIPDEGVLEQSFEVFGPGAHVLFDWNFVTAEFTGQGAVIFDSFEVTLVRSGGPTYTLISGDASGAVTYYGWSPTVFGFTFIDPVDADIYGVLSPDGSVYVEQLGWRSFGFLAAPGIYTLRFRASDDSDGFGDSALLVDNVRVEPVPEPGTLALLSALAAARLAARRQRRASSASRSGSAR